MKSKNKLRNESERENFTENEFILDLNDKLTIESVGGKAFNVSQLIRKGFVVPRGFCITTKAYDYFIDFNEIIEGEPTKILKGVMPPLLAKVIQDAYQKYVDAPCAVRSSSPFEDMKSASFAGQYESFLNVRGADQLLESVKKCWASLWSRSAYEYRKSKKVSENVKMAVLVVEMVPAEASGILFTKDPMEVEAVWGLGDLLVSGKVIPDWFSVGRDGKVRNRKISHKLVMSRALLQGGVEAVEVPEQLKDAPVLDDSSICTLCDLGKKVEDLFGCPQDIEWAFHNGRIVLLQARPICEKKPVVWTRANVAETQPGYVTYISRPAETRPDDISLGLMPLLTCFGVEIPESIRFADYFYGHIYLNITVVHEVLGQIPGLSTEVLDSSLGYKSEGEAPEPTSKPKLGVSDIVRLVPGAVRVIHFFLNLPKRAKMVMPPSLALIEDLRDRNLKELTLEELDELVWEMDRRNSEVFQVHSVTALAAMALFNVFQKMMVRIGEEGMETLLTMGLDGMSSSQLGVEMWTLAQAAAQSSRVSELILSRKENILEELGKFPEGVTFLMKMDAFMEKYGDRGSQEMELSLPRWGENPQFVLSMVGGYLSSRADPVKMMEEKRRIRLETKERLFKKVRNPVERFLIKKLLEKTELYIVTRENLKTTWVRGLSALRTLYMAIAEKLVEKDILSEKEDIVYLKTTEISEIIKGNLRKELILEFIGERRKEREECEYLDVPEVFVGKPPSTEELKYKVQPKEHFEGMGCSPGVVTGRARVVLDPQECTDLEEGDILVASVTDPGWSPLFVTAGGLVMELGGTLSHGVIIAREYGIPAVVGVKNATKALKTGQIITVDGNKGIVYVS